jgi:hypothetical protein
MTMRRSLALLDAEMESLEVDLLNPQIVDKEGMLKAIEGNTGDWLTKIDNIARMLDWWRTEREYVKQHIKYLRENSKGMEDRDNLIRQAIIDSMVKRNEKKLKFPSTGMTIYWQELDAEVVLEDEFKVPEQFLRVVPAHFEVDMIKVKEHIYLTGELVPGFKVVTNRKSLTVR